jgi:hypothetical protein
VLTGSRLPSVVQNKVPAHAASAGINRASLASSPLPQAIKSESASTGPFDDIPEEHFQKLRRAENQILLQRRGIFTKRDKRKTSKKIKRNDTPVKPTIFIENEKSAFVIDSETWEEEAVRARDRRVERWAPDVTLSLMSSGVLEICFKRNSHVSPAFGSLDSEAPITQCRKLQVYYSSAFGR